VVTAVVASDIDAILPIERRSFQQPWERVSFLNELVQRGAESLAARCSDEKGRLHVAAYIFFRTAVAEMHILKIAVAPESRRRGAATLLMKESLAIAVANGCESAYLEVRPGNTQAVMLYHKLGFNVIGRRTNYYSETGEDALVMRKNLRGK